MDALIIILSALVGLLAGGIVNALADDLPKRRPLRLPHYPDDLPRPPSAWLGVLAFANGGRISVQGAKLSWRYPLTELLTAGLMALTAYVVLNRADVGYVHLVFWLVFMAMMVLIIVIDMEHRLILFKVINPSVAIALAYVLLTEDGTRPTWLDHLIGGALGFGVFFLMYNGGFLFTYVMGKLRGVEIREVAFGYGDVMLSGLCGLILGWQAHVIGMFITVFLGAFGAIVYLVSRMIARGRYSAFAAIPYGPYIAIATIIMLLFQAQVVGLLFGTR